MGRGDGPGRPMLEMAVQRIQITLSLREGEDDDLIAFFAHHPPRKRARAVVVALRQGGVAMTGGVTPVIDEVELAAMLDDLIF
jgi:hypothetical protein